MMHHNWLVIQCYFFRDLRAYIIVYLELCRTPHTSFKNTPLGKNRCFPLLSSVLMFMDWKISYFWINFLTNVDKRAQTFNYITMDTNQTKPNWILNFLVDIQTKEGYSTVNIFSFWISIFARVHSSLITSEKHSGVGVFLFKPKSLHNKDCSWVFAAEVPWRLNLLYSPFC